MQCAVQLSVENRGLAAHMPSVQRMYPSKREMNPDGPVIEREDG